MSELVTLNPMNSSFSGDTLLLNAGYFAFAARRTLQGIIGYFIHVAPKISNLHDPLTKAGLILLTTLEIGLYGGYTLLFSATSAWRLRNIWMNQGKYAIITKDDNKKLQTTIFSGLQISSDIAAFTATVLISLEVFNLMNPICVFAYVLNSTVNLGKYSYKMWNLLHHQPDTMSKEVLAFKQAHYGIQLTLALVMATAITTFFTVTTPYAYLGLVSMWAVANIAYTYFGKERLKEHLRLPDKDLKLSKYLSSFFSQSYKQKTDILSCKNTPHVTKDISQTAPNASN